MESCIILFYLPGVKNHLDGNCVSTWKSNLLIPENLEFFRCYSDSSENKSSSESQEDTEISSTEETHNIITDSEKITGIASSYLVSVESFILHPFHKNRKHWPTVLFLLILPHTFPRACI